MALPKLNNAPSYEMEIPSINKKVRYRPFLVKEQKSLMLASESNDQKVMLRAILDTFDNCVEGDYPKNKLTSFDVEYMFLQMRAKSVGETAEVIVKCTECGKDNPIAINVEDIKIEVPEQDFKVQITDDITVELCYPTYLDMIESGLSGTEESSTADVAFKVLSNCLLAVETPDERIIMKEQTSEEVTEFIESMNQDQFIKIQNFISEIPSLKHTAKFTCKHCEHKNEMVVEGLQNFL